MEYCIVRSSLSGEIEDGVNRKISEGWIPLGGVFVVIWKEDSKDKSLLDTTKRMYCQAMTKVPPPKPPKLYHDSLPS